jgi:NAD(P)-dependent dehydrogenase (short-subunit alcohol dehydrogenase family)
MVAAGEEAFGGIDILVNNAGLARGKWSEGLELSSDDWKRIMEVNTLAPLLCARASRASMVARGGGVIVNQTSMAAYMEAGAYSVTKLALIGMTRVLSAELGGDEIRVNAIAPGVMTAKIPQDLLEAQLAMQKIGRQGTPQDLVGALLFLCSEQSSFMTGQTLLIDGGAIRGHV